MELPNIYVFVLALLVAGNAALGWIIYDLKRQTRATASSLDTIATAFAKWRDRLTLKQTELGGQLVEVKAQSPLQLSVEVAELKDAVARLAKTHQRFAGRFDRQMADAAPDNGPPTLSRDDLRREHAASILPAGVKR